MADGRLLLDPAAAEAAHFHRASLLLCQWKILRSLAPISADAVESLANLALEDSADLVHRHLDGRSFARNRCGGPAFHVLIRAVHSCRQTICCVPEMNYYTELPLSRRLDRALPGSVDIEGGAGSCCVLIGLVVFVSTSGVFCGGVPCDQFPLIDPLLFSVPSKNPLATFSVKCTFAPSSVIVSRGTPLLF